MPREQSRREVSTKNSIVHEGVVCRRGRVASKPVGQVRRYPDPVLVVWRQLLNFVPQILVEEELRQVRHHTASIRPIGQHLGPDMSDDVLVGGAEVVVPREVGVEPDNPVRVGLLHASEPCGMKPSLPAGTHAAVLSRCVAAPDVDQHVRWLASIDVDELQLEVHRNPWNAFTDI